MSGRIHHAVLMAFSCLCWAGCGQPTAGQFADAVDDNSSQSVPQAVVSESGPPNVQAASDTSVTDESDPSQKSSPPPSELPANSKAELPANGRPPQDIAKAQDPPAQHPNGVRLLVKNRTFRKVSPEASLQITYDDFDLLKVLNMEPVTPDAPELMPAWLKGLHGQRVRVRGFMYPTFEETGLRGFVLARDNQICCFGRNPKIYDLVQVTLRDGVTTDYIANRPFDVAGIFRIEAEAEDGKLYRLYQMDDAVVIR